MENRLLTVGGSSSLSLGYDPLGRLTSTVSGATTTQFLYAGSALVGEYPTSGNAPLRRYVHGPGVDEPLVWYEGSATTDRRWLLTNAQGSVIGEAGDAGAVTRTYTYGPYGEPQDWTGSRFRYTGQIMLPEAQLYHYKARVYDPLTGRFLQTDPIGYEDDLDLYAYGGGDPIGQRDPSGLCSTGSRVGGGGSGCKLAGGGDDEVEAQSVSREGRAAGARGAGLDAAALISSAISGCNGKSICLKAATGGPSAGKRSGVSLIEHELKGGGIPFVDMPPRRLDICIQDLESSPTCSLLVHFHPVTWLSAPLMQRCRHPTVSLPLRL